MTCSSSQEYVPDLIFEQVESRIDFQPDIHADQIDDELAKLILEAKMIRKGTALTQRQLAEKSGIAYQNISRLERHGAMPTLRLFMRYAHALGYTVKLIKKTESNE